MVTTIEKYKERIEDLEKQLKLSVMFNDKRRIQYLQNQINALEDCIKIREEVEEE